MRIAPEKRIWFDLPGDPDAGRVEIRHVKDGELQELLAANTITETVYREADDGGSGRQVVRARQVASPALVTAAAAVVAWENHFDEKGQPLACNPENVRKFLREDGYLRAINEFSGKLAEIVAAEKQAAEKN